MEHARSQVRGDAVGNPLAGCPDEELAVLARQVESLEVGAAFTAREPVAQCKRPNGKTTGLLGSVAHRQIHLIGVNAASAHTAVVTVAYEQRVFERRLKDLRYETDDERDGLSAAGRWKDASIDTDAAGYRSAERLPAMHRALAQAAGRALVRISSAPSTQKPRETHFVIGRGLALASGRQRRAHVRCQRPALVLLQQLRWHRPAGRARRGVLRPGGAANTKAPA